MSDVGRILDAHIIFIISQTSTQPIRGDRFCWVVKGSQMMRACHVGLGLALLLSVATLSGGSSAPSLETINGTLRFVVDEGVKVEVAYKNSSGMVSRLATLVTNGKLLTRPTRHVCPNLLVLVN